MPDVTIIQEADWTLSTLGPSLLLTPQIVQTNWSSSFCLRYSEGPSQNQNVHLWIVQFFLTLFKGRGGDQTHVKKFCCKYSIILKVFLAT